MIVNGAGGCFESRIYEIDKDFAWKIARLVINEMGRAFKQEKANA